MKIKKLLSFLLCFVIICAGLPTVVSQAENTFVTGKTQTITSTNRTTSFSKDFTIQKRGVIAFTTTHLYDVNNEELFFRYELYNTNNLSTPVWKSYSNKMGTTETGKYYYALIGVDAGSYQIKITPSIYSSSFPTSSETYSCFYCIDFFDYDCYETESNDTKATADVVSFDTPVYSHLDASEDYFAITVNQDTPARIKFKNYSGIKDYTHIRLYPADGSAADYLLPAEVGSGGDHYYFDVLLKAGTNYLNLTAYNQKGQLDYWFEVTKNISMPVPTFYKKTISGSKIEYFWNVEDGVNGYEVWRKINSGSWQKIVTSTNAKTNGFYQTGTNFKNTYQFKVRSYKKIGDVTYYSAWSRVAKLSPTAIDAKLVKNNGKWYYYEDGMWTVVSATLLKINGKWFFIEDGMWTAKTGLVKYQGKTFYVKGGKWSSKVNGLTKIGSSYYNIKSGKLSTSTTLVKKSGKLFYVKSGKWTKSTTIVKYNGKKYYVKGGIAQTKYSGKVKIGKKTYTVKKGIVK